MVKRLRSLRPMAAISALFAATTALAADSGGWDPFIFVTPVYQGTADLDSGGSYKAWSTILRAGVSGNLGGGNRAGITLNYDYTDYSFSNPARFGGWGTVQRYGIAIPLAFNAGNGWSVGVNPSLDWMRENGADTGDALAWGAILSATRRFSDGNRLGFGLGVYDRIEKTSVFPIVLVDWRFNDRWRLVNPLPAGPTGPAGLELDYRLDGAWSIGLGAAWRTTRFRLSESGPSPGGVGEERGVPVFLRMTRDFQGGVSLSLYAGVVAGGRLRVEDSGGNLLRETDFDPAPILGATFSARF